MKLALTVARSSRCFTSVTTIVSDFSGSSAFGFSSSARSTVATSISRASIFLKPESPAALSCASGTEASAALSPTKGAASSRCPRAESMS
ncbi:MAG: hypothetical protein HUU27_06305 [Phycisphaerae bacterium]|nr:hypothetical protein [Phycisphaerae bacterium]